MTNANRDLGPPIRVPRIRRCGGGCAKRNRRQGFEDSAVGQRASRACVGPSIIACARFADARSRPRAAHSAGGAKRSALTARTRTAPWSPTAPRCRDAHPRSHDARPLPAWRERPQPWPRARSQTRSDLVVASRHVPAIERVVTDGPSAGGKKRRPFGVLDNSYSLLQLRRGLEGRCHQVEARRPGETVDQ
jgi:hypothetical protein